MFQAKTVIVGNNPGSEFLAFGDDSQFGNSLTFAFAIVRRNHLKRAQKELSVLREKYNIPHEFGIHCRVLFSRNAREKIGLGHLTEDDAREIVGRIVSIFNQVPMILRFGVCDLDGFRQFAEKQGNILTLDHVDGKSTKEIPITVDPKGVIGLLAQVCFAVPPDGKNGLPANQCEIFVAKDETKVKLFGNNKSKAHRTYAGFSDIGASPDEVLRIEPIVTTPDECDMLEYADVAAYLTSHASSKDKRQKFFKDQLRRVKFWSRGVYAPNNKLQPTADSGG